MNNITALVRRIESMQERLSHLYLQASGSAMPLDVLPLALKELGPTAEVLQIATETLQQKREQEDHQSLFGHTSQAQLTTDLQGKIQAINSAAAQLFKLPASSLIGQPLSRFLSIDQRSRLRRYLKQLEHSTQSQEWISYLHSYRGQPLELVLRITLVQRSSEQQVQVHWVLQNAVSLRALLAESGLNDEQDSQGKLLPGSTVNLEKFPCYCYEKGDVIPLNLQTLWYVHQGIIRFSTWTVSNEEVVLGWVSAAMPFTASSTAMLTYQATAMTPVRLAKIPLSEIQSNCELAQLLLPKLQYRLQQAEALLNVAGQRRTEDRIYALLQFLQREVGEPIEDGAIRLKVRLTHENLANACCTTRVTVTRIMCKLQQTGKLSFDQKNHIIFSKKF